MAIAALTCVMGATVFVAKPAKAADLGGDCCADLEERLADGYGQLNDGWAPRSNGNGGNLGGVPADRILKAFTFASVNVPTEIVGSEVDRWFLALDQGFETAAMHLYLAYQHFNADMSLVTRDPSVSPNGKLKNVPVSIDDFDLIYSGGRIYF